MLRKEAQDITPDYEGLDKLVEDMFETMDASDGVGLAAPQIGKSIRLVVVDLDVLSEYYPEYKGFRRPYINPHILEIDESSPKDTQEEGCLSLPGLHEMVMRYTRIHVKYQDQDFTQHDEWIEGYLSRVMQHEFDHLDGTLFTDRVSPFRKQMIRNKLKAMAQGKFQCHYRTQPVRK